WRRTRVREMGMPEFRNIDAGNATIRVAVEGEGPLVLMVHGFPESWYSWRHQMGPVAKALQPDAPVILFGHDWGAPIVWNTALSRPDAVRAVAGLSVPFGGVPARPFTEIFKEL